MKTMRLTMAQALVRFLTAQHTERDGREQPFFAGMWGIFGHGNVAGIGQALQEHPQLPYYLARNEQAMVHAAAGFARASNRLRAFACTSSIGPGATNMITAVAGATINRLPVLLLPGDVFARRNVAPVLQQLEAPWSQEISVNDCFRPISRYWDRINRPEQLMAALPEAMRVLTSPAETGAVTLALPQDVQAEAFDYPAALFEQRVWHIARPRPDNELLRRAGEWIAASQRPLIIAGGGVIYSEAAGALTVFAAETGIPVAETQAGKGSLPYDHTQNVGAIGVSGGAAANALARDADLVIAIGTRLSDFTTASKTAFQHQDVRFVNVNVAEADVHKHAALPLAGDARATLEALAQLARGYSISQEYRARIAKLRAQWAAEVERLCNLGHAPPIIQSEVIGVVNGVAQPHDVVVCAAGSLPGDLHKLWRASEPGSYHVEYGYSCMGYEIAGGLGVKMAAPEREVYVLVGDGSYLMMSSEIATSIQEGCKLTVVLLDSHGFASIGGLSKSLGSGGFGTEYRYRNKQTGRLDGDVLRVDFVASAAALGANAVRAVTRDDLRRALEEARGADRTTVIVVEVDAEARVPSYDSWWDVPVAEVSTMEPVRQARAEYEQARRKEREFL
jgi:3D-(3,5/4)-trihydroxycyclohexane-1,2-dione acylhydrolase (decyclizing)